MPADHTPIILVVEDDADALEILTWLLESAGYRVLAARDGGEALAVLRRARVDTILLDVRMPGMDGWEFREAQRRDPDVSDIPVVVLTGDRSAADEADALQPVSCLRKPIEVSELLPALERRAGSRGVPRPPR